MEDIFQWCREGNAMQVRVWLDDTEHDMNQGDDHGFSPLHWCCKEGHLKLAELLVSRGARINATNRGDDTPLHLASAHGHKDIVQLLLRNRADVNVTNEHGNTALHYACFWGDQAVAEELVAAGALVSIANKDGDTPLDKARGVVAKRLHDLAVEYGQDLKKIQFKDQSWLGLKTRSRDATLSRHKGISMADLALHMHLASTPSGETWRGRWQNNDIVAKILNIRDCTARISRDFNEEFPKLRIFSHPNVLPVLGCVNQPPQLATVSQYMARGSLHRLLHGGTGVVVDTARALRLALDVARAMAFLHGLDRQNRCRFHLNSKHIMIDDDLTARVNMADAKFSFQEVGRIYEPAWMSPEALSKRPADINHEASDMWSFAVLLWELATREVPFADLSPMECGMKIALEDLRVSIPPGISPHLAKLIRICMNEDPGKRPSFDMVVPILDKMKRCLYRSKVLEFVQRLSANLKMAAVHRFARFTERAKFLSKCYFINQNGTQGSFCTMVQQPQRMRSGLVKFALIGAVTGTAVGAGYAYRRIKETRKNIALEGTQLETALLKHKPPITPSRKITSPVDSTGLKLTLFQYQTCPFCCKVRVFLDYYGISYDIVEVDPVLRKEIGWSSYKKVPILLTKVDGGYQPLNDSTMIVSLLASYFYNTSHKIEELANYYPSIGMHEENGKFKYEIINKYFLMFNKQLPKDRSMNDITEERNWRKWADEVFIHTLSPNVYRTINESYKTFNWFSEVGKWEEYFPSWERLLIVNVGAMAMWLIGKKLKKRHRLKDDVRQSLYDEANYWLRGIKARGTTFMGGSKPDLSDLAVYGILKSIEGCDAFQDLLTHTKIGIWYNAVREQVDAHSGNASLSR